MRKRKIAIALIASIVIIGAGAFGIYVTLNHMDNIADLDDLKITQEDTTDKDENKNENALKDEEKLTEEPDEQPEQKADEIVTVTLSAAGDVTLGNTQLQGYEGTFIEMYDKQGPTYFLSQVLPIFSQDDMTLVNFEGVLTEATEKKDKEFNLKGRPEFMQILNEGSVECVAFANNHRLDYYEVGAEDTVKGFQNHNIVYAYNENVAIYEVHGIKMGYVSVDSSHGEGVRDVVRQGIEKLKEQGANCVIVYIHWGIELDHYPQKSQEELGHEMIQMGADLVLGAHPHVLQGIEIYQGKPIVYSLGNFCFGGNKNPKRKNSMIYQQTFTFINGQLSPKLEAKVIPCTISSVDWRNDFCPTPQEGSRATEILTELQTYSKSWNTQINLTTGEVTEQ